jgi:hypothetical protein
MCFVQHNVNIVLCKRRTFRLLRQRCRKIKENSQFMNEIADIKLRRYFISRLSMPHSSIYHKFSSLLIFTIKRLKEVIMECTFLKAAGNLKTKRRMKIGESLKYDIDRMNRDQIAMLA